MEHAPKSGSRFGIIPRPACCRRGPRPPSPRRRGRTAASARHDEWTTDKRETAGFSPSRAGSPAPSPSQRGRGAAAPAAASARHRSSGQPTERGNGRFFTVAAGFARSVSIAAGRGAAALAAASARHDEWTISRRETAGFHRRGRARSTPSSSRARAAPQPVFTTKARFFSVSGESSSQLFAAQ